MIDAKFVKVNKVTCCLNKVMGRNRNKDAYNMYSRVQLVSTGVRYMTRQVYTRGC